MKTVTIFVRIPEELIKELVLLPIMRKNEFESNSNRCSPFSLPRKAWGAMRAVITNNIKERL